MLEKQESYKLIHQSQIDQIKNQTLKPSLTQQARAGPSLHPRLDPDKLEPLGPDGTSTSCQSKGTRLKWRVLMVVQTPTGSRLAGFFTMRATRSAGWTTQNEVG